MIPQERPREEVRPDVDVVTGDSDQFHWGTGTFASRGAVVAGNATHEAAKSVREKAIKLAAEHLGAPEDRIELAEGCARVIASGAEPERSISLGKLATVANPMRGAVKPAPSRGWRPPATSAPTAAPPPAAATPASWRSTPRRCR